MRLADYRVAPRITLRSHAGYMYPHAMTTVDDIEKAVARLAPDELAKFRVWFEAFEAERFDRKIERDAKPGKLDRLADEALAEFRAAAPASCEALRKRRVLAASVGWAKARLRAVPTRFSFAP
ncbi:MAG: hypothetical protein QOG83_1503 [Alphaproteobacteria bacterium]|nr:hypothetical protein [Alphaproteobacteria bacterium]